MGRIKYQEAVGLEVKRGRPPAGPAPAKDQLVRLYVKEGRAIRDIAATLGCSKDMVRRALKKYAIEPRTTARRSILLQYRLSDLRTAVKEKGIRGYARELGINPSTLSRFLRSKADK